MMRSALVLFFSCVASVALGQQSPAPPTVESVSIRGRIVAADSGIALRRARVAITAGTRRIDSVFTDDDGRFVVTAPPSGSFSVIIAKGGYAFATATLSRAEAAVPLAVRLGRAAAIAGRVLDQRGRPAMQAPVTARRLDADASSAGVPTQFSSAADDLGEYRIGGLPPGRYAVTAVGPPSTITGIQIRDGVATAVTQMFGFGESIDASRSVMLERTRGATVVDGSTAPAGPAQNVVFQAAPGATMPEASPAPAGAVQNVVLQAGDDVGGVDFVVQHIDRLKQMEESLKQLEAGRIAAAEQAGVPLQPAARPQPPPGLAGAIRGQVTSESGESIDQVQVRVSGAGFDRSMTTDGQGRFALSGLRAGDYTVEASKPGYVSLRYGQQRAMQAGRAIAVGTDETVDGIDLVLPRGSAMTGLVVDEHGEPLQGVLVQALQLRDTGGRVIATRAGGERRTDDRGRYRLLGLLPGTYVVAASADAAVPAADGRNPVGYAPFYYPGTPVIDTASHIPLSGDAAAINLVFTPSPAVRIRGVVVDAEGPLVTGSVRLAVSRRSSAISLEPRSATIGPDGAFVFSNIPPGEYVVQAHGDGPGRTGEFGIEHVSVADADPPPLTIRASHGATLEGRFVVEGTPEAATCVTSFRAGVSAGSPCDTAQPAAAFGVLPIAVDADRGRVEGSSGLVTSSTGAFYASGLTGPTAFILRRAPAEGWYLKSVTINGADVADAVFDFGTGPQDFGDAEIVLSHNGATISGRVTDRAAAVDDYSVVVFPVLRDQWLPQSRRLKFTRSSRDGSFRVTGLPPGDYFVAAVNRLDGTADAGEWQSAGVLDQLSSTAERVSVAEGESRATTLRLIRR